MAELTGARGRRLTQQWCQSAQFTFTLDGASAAAALVQELAMDVIAWRWDDQTGADVAMFRGIIAQSEDQITEQANVVTFTAHDYFAVLARRYVWSAINWVGGDQDEIVGSTSSSFALLIQGKYSHTILSSGAPSAQLAYPDFFQPGAYVPLSMARVNPNGTARGLSGQLRTRTYPVAQSVGQAIDDLSKVIGGFDYDIQPAPQVGGNEDALRVFYPYQGVTRSTPVLAYGSTVASLSRTVDSANYANDVWCVGADHSGGAIPQWASEANNVDANNVAVTPVGLWQITDNAADVSVQATLDQKAAGDLAYYGVLQPTYTLGLRPGVYSLGNPNMGDVVPLMIQTGRLNVNNQVRVVGIDYDIGDDGQEDVILTVGRPPATFKKLLTATHSDVAALTRR